MAGQPAVSKGEPAPIEGVRGFWTLIVWFRRVLGPDSSYFWLTIIYGIAVSLLTLALPISVQMLIDTVANTALAQQVIVLSLILMGLLLLSGLLVALRTHVMELFGRRIYARLTGEIALRSVHSHAPYFQEGKRDSLFNRFFDIMLLQTNIPSLLTGGFTLMFQGVIGFIVVSLYHPYFLVYNLILILLLWAVWSIWGGGAIRTAIRESYAKYETAHNLEGLAENNDFYKSERNIEHALKQADGRIGEWIKTNKAHFRYSFAQTVSLLVLYAVGSAALLGIGGWLVIQGQLTLGQLVAAELIMSAILFGMSQFGGYLDQFYEVCAAVDKLSIFYRIPQEPDSGRADVPDTPPRVEFDGVRVYRRDGEEIAIDLDLPAGSNIIVNRASVPASRAFLSLLQGYERPESGWVRLGGVDLTDIDANKLRCQVLVLDRPDIIECTVDSYLDLSCDNSAQANRTDVLKLTGLDEVVHRLSRGANTQIIPSGWPLTPSEVLRLKLAGALLSRPKVLVMSQLFDLVERRYLEPIIARIAQDRDITFIRFTDDPPKGWADYELVLRGDDQQLQPLAPPSSFSRIEQA